MSSSYLLKFQKGIQCVLVTLLLSVSLGDSRGLYTTVRNNDIVKRSEVRPRQCLDKYYVIDGHTMCLGDIVYSHLLRSAETNVIENKHNKIRSEVTPPASDMLKIEYNKGLEIEAHLWAEQCLLTHDRLHARFKPGQYHVGQNIAIISGGKTLWEDVIDVWDGEKTSFVYGSNANDINVVGNYTQMVWAETSVVGCAVTNCSGFWFYVCNYATRQDETRLSQPYSKSLSIQSCDKCVDNCTNNKPANKTVIKNLCDCSGLICQNGGRVNLTTCKCECMTVSDFYQAPYCSIQCDYNGDLKECGHAPFDKDSCRTSLVTPFKCPWMCDICPYASNGYRAGSVTFPTTESSNMSQILPTDYTRVQKDFDDASFGLTSLEFYLALALIIVTVIFTLILLIIILHVTKKKKQGRRIRHNSHKMDF